MSRIGVFICHCGENIARTVDCGAVAEALREHPGVVVAEDYKYMCSDPGQQLIKKAIADNDLTGVVVCACSPHMHEKTFRRAAAQAGLNPFVVEMANIREHCSWIHDDRGAGDRQGDRHRPHHRREGQAQQAAADHPHTGDQARPGDRRRHRRHPGGARHRRRRPRGRAGRKGGLDRRPHEPALRDLPHPRLLAVHPHAAHGRGLSAPAHQALHLERGRKGRRLHRQLQRDHPPARRARSTKTCATAAATVRQPVRAGGSTANSTPA